MTYKTADRVYETSVTAGVGDYTLDGAQVGFQSFGAGIGANNICPYFATDDTNWESGVGTVLAGPNRLQRTVILASSNAGAAVNWGAGTRKLRCGMPAANSPRAAVESRTANTILGAADFGKTIVITSGTFSQTFAAVATLGDGWRCRYNNRGTGIVTLDPNAAENINGAATLALAPGHGGWIVCDGTALFMLVAPSMDNGQIKFPATQNASSDANTFDDYEEGTWTPTIAAGITTPTYSTQIGRYTKAGRLVHISYELITTGTTTNGSQLQIGGVPFATGDTYSGCVWSLVNGQIAQAARTSALPFMSIQSSSIFFYDSDSSTYNGTELLGASITVAASGVYSV